MTQTNEQLLQVVRERIDFWLTRNINNVEREAAEEALSALAELEARLKEGGEKIAGYESQLLEGPGKILLWLKEEKDKNKQLRAELEARLRWIPVSERLPEPFSRPVITKSCFVTPNGLKLITVNGESYMKTGGRFENDEGLTIEHVVAWMPQPPAGE